MARKRLNTLTEPMFYILLALKYKNMYGYEIVQWIKSITNSKVIIGLGTVYNLLSRFEYEQIVRMTNIVERKKIYIITTKGEELLALEYNRITRMINDYDEIDNK